MIRALLLAYNLIFIPIAFFIITIISCFNSKIRQGLKGRIRLNHKIKTSLPPDKTDRPRIWIHVSSYGEYLQAKPVLEQLKRLNSNLFIIVTVFSPSGIENINLQQPVDYLCYLPFDTYFGMKKFISLISPKVVVIVRHDIWANFVWRLRKQNIPLFLIDASLPEKSSRFFPVWKQINQGLFSQITAILAISEQEAERFLPLIKQPEKIIVTGDTKYDQVYERSKNTEKISHLLKNPNLLNKNILVAGSTWEPDEAVIFPAFQKVYEEFKNSLLIIAPHEPTAKRIEEIENRCSQYGFTSICLSEIKNNKTDFQCLIVNQVGLLAVIYSLGNAAFVGGSFYYKIHNVLEPAVYGVPVFFGPKMTTSAEAYNLLNNNAAVMVDSVTQIVSLLTKIFQDPKYAEEFGNRAKDVVKQNVGSSRKIAELLLKEL